MYKIGGLFLIKPAVNKCDTVVCHHVMIDFSLLMFNTLHSSPYSIARVGRKQWTAIAQGRA